MYAGNFYRLISAGHPLGERQPGVDVPLMFEPLSPGPIIYSQPQLPGRLSANNIRETGADFRAPMYPDACVSSVAFFSFSNSDVLSRISEPGVRTSSGYTEKEDTPEYPTYGGDAQRESMFIAYMERHYESWVMFARAAGHGDDIEPVIITGVNMTQDFVMMGYSNNGANPRSGFMTQTPMVSSAPTSVWSTPRTEWPAYTNPSPQLYYPPSSAQAVIVPSYSAPYPQTQVYYTATPALLLSPYVSSYGRNAYTPSPPSHYRSM